MSNETETKTEETPRVQRAVAAVCKLRQYEDVDVFVDLLSRENPRLARDVREALTVAHDEGRVD